MSCGEKHSVWFCLIQPTMKKAMKKAQSYWLFGVKWLKNSWQNSISQRKKSRISWIRSLRPMQNWPNMSCQMKKNPSTTNSTILMNGQISRPWFQNCHLIASLQKWLDKHQIKSSCRKSVFGRNLRQNSIQQPTGKPFMLNWNSAQLFLGLPSWPKKSVSCLVNMDGPSQGHQKHVRKKRQLWLWQKGLIAKRLDSGMRAKNSHQKRKQT